jgi:tetratricopeptide (TPR) repeat protein
MSEKLSKLNKISPYQPEPEVLIREFLLKQSTEFLVEQLMNQIQRDDILFRNLYLKAERASGVLEDVTSFRKAIDHAARIDDFIGWREAGDFASGLHEIINSLEELKTPESAEDLVDLAEYFIVSLDKSLESVDDSNGEVGEVLRRLENLHLDACILAKPEPLELAERLFHYEMTMSFDSFYDSLNKYQDVLGENGGAHYRVLAEKQWEQIKPVNADDKNRTSDNGRRFRITKIMETLANMSGDINALVAIKSRDLSMPYHYLTIAEIFQKAGQTEQALEWAERGLKEFPGHQDNRVRDFLASEYIKCERTAEAEQLVWVQFEEKPELAQFCKLHDLGKKLGNWTALRERALSSLENTVVMKASTITRWHPQPTQPDWSQRIEIAIWENDLETAWQFSQMGDCRRRTLLSLAEKLEKHQSNNAASLYCIIIPSIVDETNNQAYREAVRYLSKLGGIYRSLDKTEEFAKFVASLRIRFKAKRNFIKLLDESSKRP